METKSTRHYRYDALDVLASCSHPGQAPEQRFYQAGLLTSEIHGPLRRSVLQSGQQLLGVQQRSDSGMETALLGTDQQRSVLHGGSGDQRAYGAYGFCQPLVGIASLLGFNGERPDPLTGHYLLGSYRAFNPVLMRFNSPDNMSPFDEGGLNAYAYCQGNPINQRDPTGHNVFSTLAELAQRALTIEDELFDIARGNFQISAEQAAEAATMQAARTAEIPPKPISAAARLRERQKAIITQFNIDFPKERLEQFTSTLQFDERKLPELWEGAKQIYKHDTRLIPKQPYRAPNNKLDIAYFDLKVLYSKHQAKLYSLHTQNIIYGRPTDWAGGSMMSYDRVLTAEAQRAKYVMRHARHFIRQQ